jgi:hypothetical protein
MGLTAQAIARSIVEEVTARDSDGTARLLPMDAD